MKIEDIAPDEIEKRSFEIIESELEVDLDPVLKPIVKRVIHTTADFSYASNLYFTKGVVEKALEAIRSGASIVTDTNMGKAGINKNKLAQYGGSVYCFMADKEVAEEAKKRGVTRAAVSMEKAAKMNENVIFAIGNAPTALIKLHQLIKENQINPYLIIGVPVGFVNVIEAKELIINTNVASIIARGRKGGSNVAAAICNAIIYMLDKG